MRMIHQEHGNRLYRAKCGRFQLQLLVEQAGSVVRDLWGGHKGQPLGARTYNMIFVAEKGPTADGA